VWPEGLGKLKKASALIRNGTHNLPVCSKVPQPTTLLHAPNKNNQNKTVVIWEEVMVARLMIYEIASQ
jgi:hypothetical protein